MLNEKEKAARQLKNRAMESKRNLRNALDKMKDRNARKLEKMNKKVEEARSVAAAFAEALRKEEERAAPHEVPARLKTKGRPYPLAFEQHVRSLMATGVSAEACREQINLKAKYFLHKDQYQNIELPDVRWFNRQREAAGIHTIAPVVTRTTIITLLIEAKYK